MSTKRKVELVASVRDEHDLKPALAAVDLPKSTWYYHQNEKVPYEEKYAHLRPVLEEIAREHPSYGYRRTTEELRDTYGYDINHKVVQRLHKLWDLHLLRSTRPPQPSPVRRAIIEAGERANLVAQLAKIEPFAVCYTDFTELYYANGRRKAHLIPIIGHCCKMAYGWAVARQANTALALRAWERAKERFAQYAIAYEQMIMHHDQDPVFTSYAWTGQLLLDDGLRLSYALHGARDNPEMEAFFSRFKSEGQSLFLEADTVSDLIAVVDRQMTYHNTERRHSSIGYQAPIDYVKHGLSS